MTVKDRIKEFCKAERLTISAFEESIGVSNGYVNAISKSIGLDKLNTIIEKYSNLNIEWLLTGKGEMRKTKRISGGVCADGEHAPESDNTNKGKQNIPENNGNPSIISQLLDTIKQQAEEIGQLKALVTELEQRIRTAEDTHTEKAAG